jgi:HK97 gp10 family phage protein
MKGAARHAARLKRLEGISRKLRPVVYDAADVVAAEAALLITTGSVGFANHVPSLPGEPPNADTGQLDRSIHVEQVDDLTARVVANAPHAVPLEFGTSKMAERPFMRPAAKKVAPQMHKKIREIVKRETR